MAILPMITNNMLKLSLKNRIASYYIISTALLVFIVFITIYTLISYTIYTKVNEHIDYEVNEYLEKIEFVNNQVQLIDKEEWKNREHNEVSVDPVFLEITNKDGISIEKSENLKNKELFFLKDITKSVTSDIKLSGQLVRQVQVPLFDKNNIDGYMLIAVSLEEATIILNNLRTILYITFPIILVLLFIVARIIAGRSIKPINAIIETSNKITKDNLKSRIDLPKNKDELYLLSETINSLLDRIEKTIDREKQFTSDASHELRTPLAVIKGTLEVLIRKPRNTEEYQQKINFCIAEVDRINNLVDQLLLLARFENQKISLKNEDLNLNQAISEVMNRFSAKIKNKNISVIENYTDNFQINSDEYFISIILQNIISNALKYSHDGGKVQLNLFRKENQTIFEISNTGIGIAPEEIGNVFNSFYRTKNSIDHPETKGTGLGLSITKRLCNILGISISITSDTTNLTTLKLSIP